MIANLKEWEGQLVNGEFLLQRSLGGSEHSAVFLIEKSADGQSQTVVGFIDANWTGATEQSQLWEMASTLSHPNLLRIFKTGQCQMDGGDFLYALSEFAEENLSQILPQRALTTEETRQVLEAVLPALAYIHGEGLVHGSLKPSNIFAVDNTVKISSDTLRPAGRPCSQRADESIYDAPETDAGTLAPSADVWSLGITLCEALTQRLPVLDPQEMRLPALPQGIAQPFQEIIENCLQLDPARRWTVAQIAACLSAEKREAVRPVPVTVPPPAAQRPAAVPPAVREMKAAPPLATLDGRPSAKWLYAIALLAAVIVAIVLVARPKRPAAPSSSEEAQQSVPAASSTHQHVLPAASRAGATASAPGIVRAGRGRVVERVMPRVSPAALGTITGRVRIALNVKVDEAGHVTNASLKSGKSRYFIRQSIEAANGWEFQPPLVNGRPVASQWLVQFAFGRRDVNDSARQIYP